MAYRERIGWTPTNYIVESRRNEVNESSRIQHLRQVTGTLTTSRDPSEGSHVRLNMKKAIARDVEFAKVEFENLLLLSKLHKTALRPSSSGPSRLTRRGQKSMNLRNRRTEIERIEKENMVSFMLLPDAFPIFVFLSFVRLTRTLSR